MDVSSLVAILLGGLGSLVLWLILGPIMTGYGFKKLVQKAIDGDEKSMKVFMDIGTLLMVWATQTKFKTGNKIKVKTDEVDANGKPIFSEEEEILTPVQTLSKAVGTYAFEKLRSSAGGVKTQLGNALQQEFADSSGWGLSPAALSGIARGNLKQALIEIGMKYYLDKRKKGDINSDSDTGRQGGW